MFIKDPAKRIDIEGIRNHPWVLYGNLPPPIRVNPKFEASKGDLGCLIQSIYLDEGLMVYTFQTLVSTSTTNQKAKGRTRSDSLSLKPRVVNQDTLLRNNRRKSISVMNEQDLANLRSSLSATPSVNLIAPTLGLSVGDDVSKGKDVSNQNIGFTFHASREDQNYPTQSKALASVNTALPELKIYDVDALSIPKFSIDRMDNMTINISPPSGGDILSNYDISQSRQSRISMQSRISNSDIDNPSIPDISPTRLSIYTTGMKNTAQLELENISSSFESTCARPSIINETEASRNNSVMNFVDSPGSAKDESKDLVSIIANASIHNDSVGSGNQNVTGIISTRRTSAHRRPSYVDTKVVFTEVEVHSEPIDTIPFKRMSMVGPSLHDSENLKAIDQTNPPLDLIQEWHEIHRPPKAILHTQYNFKRKCTSSSLDPSSMFQDLHQAILKVRWMYEDRISFKRHPDYYMLMVEYRDPVTPELSTQFEAEIRKVYVLNLHQLKCRRTGGNAIVFNDIQNLIINELNWTG